VSKGNLVWGIDIGTGKVAVSLIEHDSKGAFFVRSVGVAGSQGVKRGTIHGYELLNTSLGRALKQASEGQKIHGAIPAFINLSGENIIVRRPTFKVAIKGKVPKVKKNEIETLAKQVSKDAVRAGEHLLHTQALSYVLDGGKAVEEPLGLPARNVERQVFQVSTLKEEVKDLIKFGQAFKLDVQALVFNPYASAEIMLSDEEKKSGVVQIEMGAGVCNVSLWRGGRLEMSENFFVAGGHVESDIAHVLKISQNEARRLLFEQAQVMPTEISNRKIEVRASEGHEKYQVGHDFLCKVVQSRMHEILSLAWHRMQRWKKFTQVPARVVLSGGLAQINKIDEFCARIFEMPVRRGIPEEKWDLIDDPMYTQSIGICLYAKSLGLLQPKSFFKKLLG
jgi:cell division protein FtsA